MIFWVFFAWIQVACGTEVPIPLPPMLSGWWTDAIDLESEGKFTEAILKVRGVRRGQPEFIPALVAEGRLLTRLGREEEALALYDLQPYDAQVLEARVRILLSLSRWEESLSAVESLHALGWVNAWFLKAQAMAPVDAEESGRLLSDALRNMEGEINDQDLAQSVLWVINALLESGSADQAQRILSLAMTRFEEPPEAIALLSDRVFIEVQANLLRRRPEQELTSLELKGLELARTEYGKGDLIDSLKRLDQDLADKPFNTAVCWLRYQNLYGLQRYSEAEQVLRLLERLEPLDPTPSIRLGALLDEFFPSERSEVLFAYDRASKKQPTNAQIWIKKATVEARLNLFDASKLSLLRAQKLKASDSAIKRVATTMANQGRKRLKPIQMDVTDGCEGIPSKEACARFYRSMAYFYRAQDPTDILGKNDWTMALDELKETEAALEEYVPAWNLRGAIYLARGEDEGSVVWMDEAEAAYTRSLAIDSSQPRVLTLLGVLEHWKGNQEKAIQRWQQAVQLQQPGSREASLYLAEEAASRWQWWTAKAYLNDRAFYQPATMDVHAKTVVLKRRVELYIWGVYGSIFTVLLLSVLGIVFRLSRKYSGKSIEDFLSEHPDAHDDIAHICATIRHEVVKHNTPLLSQIAHANLEQETTIREKIFGPRGVIARFDTHVDELYSVAARRGVKLNLEHRDTLFSGLISAMGRLEKWGPERIFQPAYSKRVADVADQINLLGFAELGNLISIVSTTDLRKDSVFETYKNVLKEPQFYGMIKVPVLTILPCEEPVVVRATLVQLETIFSNLFRNVLELSNESEPSSLQVRWGVEEDPITMEREVAIRVADSISIFVTTEMIRSRYIAHGLGIVTQLSTQLKGSICVENEPGFEKAIVVRLPIQDEI